MTCAPDGAEGTLSARLALAARGTDAPDPLPPAEAATRAALATELAVVLMPASGAGPAAGEALPFDVLNRLALLLGTLRALRGPQVSEPVARALHALGRASADARARARGAWAHANELKELGRHEEAATLLGEAGEIFLASAGAAPDEGRRVADLRRAGLILATRISPLAHLGRDEEAQAVATACACALEPAPEGVRHEVLAILENNLAAVDRGACRFEAAVGHLERSIAHQEALGRAASALRARLNRAYLLSNWLHDPHALREIEAALATARARGDRFLLAEALPLLADELRRRGRLRAALSALDPDQAGIDLQPMQRAVFDRVRAALYLDVHLAAEARRLASASEQALRGVDAAPERVHHLLLVAGACLALRETSDGPLKREDLLREAEAALARADATDAALPAALKVDAGLRRAEIALARGRTEDAAHLLLEVPALGALSPLQRATRSTLLAEALLEADPRAALATLEADGALPLALTQALGPRRAALAARALGALGRDADALAVCQQELAAGERRLALIEVDVLRVGHAASQAAVCELGAALALELGHPDDALALLARQRHAPARGAEASAAPATEEADALRARRRALSEELNAHAQRRPRDAAAEAALERALQEVALALHPTDGSEAPSPEAELARLRQRLPVGEAVLWVGIVAGRVVAFVLAPGAAGGAVDLGPRAPVDAALRAWRNLIRLRSSARAEALRAHGQACLARLHDLLLAPVAEALEPARVLHVALPATWDDLPLQALAAGGAPLAARHELRRISALGDALLVPPDAARLTAAPGRALVVADSYGGVLTQTAPEARRVTELLAGAGASVELLAGDPRDPERLAACAGELTLLHLASHGAFHADNPLFSAVWVGGRPLRALDLYELSLPRAPLLVLSACEGGRMGAQGSAAIGIARALRAAGAGPLIVSQWEVGDAAAVTVMERLYHGLLAEGLHAGAALTAAQRALCERLPVEEWAAFVYLGG